MQALTEQAHLGDEGRSAEYVLFAARITSKYSSSHTHRDG